MQFADQGGPTGTVSCRSRTHGHIRTRTSAAVPDGTREAAGHDAGGASQLPVPAVRHALQVFPQQHGCWGRAGVLKKKAKPWWSVFVHVEGVPRSQSVWDSRGQRKPLRPLAEEEVGVPRLEAGRALIFSPGGGGGELEKGAQPKKSARKEEAQKASCWCDCSREGWRGACPHGLSQQGGGCRFCGMWEKRLRFGAGGSGRSREDTAGRGGGVLSSGKGARKQGLEPEGEK